MQMKIRVLGNRNPVIDGQKRPHGYECDVSQAIADQLFVNNLAEEIIAKKQKKSIKVSK